MNDDPRRLIEYLQLARGYLEGKGIENPRGNAEALLGKALGLPRVDLYLQHDRPLRDTEVAAFRELLRKRATHVPLQHLLGEAEFLGIRIEVTPGLLIPRSETEQLAEYVSDRIRITPGNSEIRVLDIGCGTGCIGIALAAADHRVRVDAVDIDFLAIRNTEKNAVRNGVGGSVRCVYGDLLSDKFLASVACDYDWIVSNPPYIPKRQIASLEPEVRNHEPLAALDGGESGLEFYKRIAGFLPQILNRGGRFAVEIGIHQDAAVVNIFSRHKIDAQVIPDLSGTPRILTGELKDDSLS